MKKLFLLLGIFSCLFVSSYSWAFLVNGSFEQPLNRETDWRGDGVVGCFQRQGQGPTFNRTGSFASYYPEDGEWFVQMYAQNSFAENPIDVYLWQTLFNLHKGDKISGWAAYRKPNGDFDGNGIGWVELQQWTQGSEYPSINQRLEGRPWEVTSNTDGWQYWEWTITQDGNYFLLLGVTRTCGQDLDYNLEPYSVYACYDNIKLSPVPIPGTLLLLSSGLAGMLVIRRKHR